MSTTISAPQGFFIDDAVTPATVSDLGSAVDAAQNALSSVTSAVSTTSTNATAAANSATAAAGSANSASTSASNAATSASNASTSASTATTQASNASTSASNAAASATSAANSASSASTSATNAANSATSASNSATSASTSATNASNSATSASSSASSASTSASTATTQASNAATSASNAATSATNASNSASTATSYAAAPVLGYNWAPNPRFTINQRGNTSFSSNGYTLDRWFLTRTGSDTTTAQVQAITDTDRANIGDESAVQSLMATVFGTSGGSSYVGFRVPNVRSMANGPMVLTVYVRGSATARFAASYDQVFGTGGSPSATVSGNIGVSPTITNGFAKYTLTFTPPSTSGKTFGTNGDDYTQILLWLSDGTSDARSGGLGVQSTGVVVQFWGVKLEKGSSGTALAPEDYVNELEECQRFYTTFSQIEVAGYNAAGGAIYLDVTLPTTMWKAPSITLSSFSNSNASNASVVSTTADSFILSSTVTATGVGNSSCAVVCEADL